MPYIDSAGVKLNKNADIIIEVNAAGTVTSCRDAVTGAEYAINEAILTVENTTASSKNITAINYVPNPDDGRYYFISQSNSTPANSIVEHKLVIPTRITKTSNMTSITGDCYIAGSYIYIYGKTKVVY